MINSKKKCQVELCDNDASVKIQAKAYNVLVRIDVCSDCYQDVLKYIKDSTKDDKRRSG